MTPPAGRDETTPAQMREILDHLSAIFPRYQTTDARVDAWVKYFRHHPAHRVWAAVRAWCAENNRLPTPADIMDRIRQSERGRATTTGPTPTRPAQVVECMICDNGWVEIPDPEGGDTNTVAKCPAGCRPNGRTDIASGKAR